MFSCDLVVCGLWCLVMLAWLVGFDVLVLLCLVCWFGFVVFGLLSCWCLFDCLVCVGFC